MSDLVTLEIVDGLARLTLNRPGKLNAVSAASFRELDRHLDSIGDPARTPLRSAPPGYRPTRVGRAALSAAIVFSTV